MIFFSVIIPTYNRAQLITETIDTILQQTYPHFEVIIVDDGSTDNTGQIITARYGSDSRVRYFYKENEERGAARNYGMKKAKGDYAIIFDSDDWMHSNHLSVLEKNISAAGKKREINFIAAKYQLREDNGKMIKGGSSGLPEGWYGLDLILKGNYFGCMYAIKLSNPELKYFPADRAFATLEDWMFLLDNMKNDAIYLIDEITITVRHDQNRSVADNKRVINVRGLATRWALDNIPLTEQRQRKLKAWSHYFCGIHQYLDGNRKASVRESIAAIRLTGINWKFLVLLAKSIIGRKIITRLK
jgi:GalNAc5-diNAcBac-PP-undecaprenol beta-1,3-glucosyltransferase